LVFYKKIRQGINARNNHYENKVTAIQNGYTSSVSFFNRRRKLEIILLITTSNNVTAGSVITIYSYVNNFLTSLMSIPVAFERIN